ncbi:MULTISPECIES: hypothetical protein [Bradyrhizobium]|uniref:hypothetical protein n=1 Tax=Bradyrhizobium elkanii TaxID=29448 RepID=UPI0027155589|nr:hypothetical protein [Bradyrhizobium elkanii]WLB84902.1 hypothetical protein QIH83_21080 [Bradyrhizobium elkanii]
MKTKSKSTERVRRFRERQANGRFRVVMDLDEAERDALEAAGVLKDWNSEAENREAIASTALLLLRQWLSRETRFKRLSEDLLSPESNQEEDE